jgi:hypothetical protein
LIRLSRSLLRLKILTANRGSESDHEAMPLQ